MRSLHCQLSLCTRWLAAACAAWLAAGAAAGEQTAAAAERAVLRLPTLASGPGAGAAIYYRGSTYDGRVLPDGALVIQPRDADGQAVGQAQRFGTEIRTWWRNPEATTAADRTVYREMTGLLQRFEPQLQPSKPVSVRARLSDGVEFVRVYDFAKDEVVVISGYRCSNDARPSHYHSTVSVPPCMQFPPAASAATRRQALARYSLTVDGMVDGRRQSRTAWSMADGSLVPIRMPRRWPCPRQHVS
jgi:hypothetical protein